MESREKINQIWQQLKSKVVSKARDIGVLKHFINKDKNNDGKNVDSSEIKTNTNTEAQDKASQSVEEKTAKTTENTNTAEDKTKQFSNGQVLSNLKQLSTQKKIRQYLLAGIIGVLVCSVGVYLLIGEDEEVQKKTESGFLPPFKGTKLKNLETSKDNINPDQIYKHKVQKELQKTQSDIQEIRQSLAEKANSGDGSNGHDKDVLELNKKLLSLERKLDNMSFQSTKDGTPTLSISKINVRLNNKEQKKLKTVDNTIPAGSFASGVLLSGLDASTSLSSSGNPTPMLIRLTDHGTLPRRFKSDLKDCHVIASGYGDISSERVLTRLERLTCIENLTGEILETGIAGYISGEDGKAGLRGVVVSKDFKYLANSAVGGILGGFSNTITPKQNIPFIATKDALSQPSIGERFQKGFGDGMSSSMDKLSQYYIDRAETLQPVIEVSAGRIVDIIFTQGVEIGSSVVKEELSVVRDESRKKAARNSAISEE